MYRANLWKTFKDQGGHSQKIGRPKQLDKLRLINKANELLQVEEELDEYYLYSGQTTYQIVTLQLSPDISRILTRE